MSDIKKLKEKFAKKKFICINRHGSNVTHKCKKDDEGKYRVPRAAEGYKWVRVPRDEHGKPWKDGKRHWQEVRAQMTDDEAISSSSSSSSDESTSSSDFKKKSSTNFIESDSDEDFNFKELYENTSKDDADEQYMRATGKFPNDGPRKKKATGRLSSDGSGFLPSSGASSSAINTLVPRRKKSRKNTGQSGISIDYEAMYNNCNNELNSLKSELLICKERNRKLGVEKLQAEVNYENVLNNLRGGRRTRRRRRKRGAVRTKHNTPKVFDPKTNESYTQSSF